MKKLICLFFALCLLAPTLCGLMSCGEKQPSDYVKGTDVVIDNETPYIYSDETKTSIKGNIWGTERTYSLLEFAGFCCGASGPEQEAYSFFAHYFGNKPVRELVTEEKTLYYTVYSLCDNELLYLYLEKDGDEYICSYCYPTDGRMDAEMKDRVYPQDLPTAILGDKLPSYCYLENYTPEEIAQKNESIWSWYYNTCNQINIPHSINHDRDGIACQKFIRCIESVSFDLVRDENTYHGYYVYDLYVHENGAGVLYFYHLYYKNWLQQSAFHIIQEETIPLTVEEVASVVDVMVEQDFAHHPTWNPEEFTGMDGSSTDIFAVGNFGGGGYEEHLISMWEPNARYPHYHIRTAIEDLVRTHVTVEEGRIYRPELYE